MLHAISWGLFLKTLLALLILYYAVILFKYYPEVVKKQLKRFRRKDAG